MTVKKALEMVSGTEDNASIKSITESEWEDLNNIKIVEQHMATTIADTLLDYPSLIHKLVESGAKRVVLDTIHGTSKPIIRIVEGIATIYLNE